MASKLRNLLVMLGTSALVSLGAKLCVDSQPTPSAVAPSSETAPSLRLAFPGIAPREALRLTAQDGYEEEVLLGLTVQHRTVQQSSAAVPTGLEGAEAGGVQLQPLLAGLGVPPDGVREAAFTVELEVEDADAESLTVAWRIVGASVFGDSDPAWDDAVQSARKLRGTTVLGRDGLPRSASVKGARDETAASAALHTTLRRLFAEPAPILPAEPVGHGAIWELSRTQVDRGVRAAWEQRWEVVGLGAGVLSLAERSTGAQKGEGPGRIGVIDTSTTGMSAQGEGRWEQDLGGLMADGALHLVRSVDTTLTLGLSEVTIRSETTTDLQIERR